MLTSSIAEGTKNAFEVPHIGDATLFTNVFNPSDMPAILADFTSPTFELINFPSSTSSSEYVLPAAFTPPRQHQIDRLLSKLEESSLPNVLFCIEKLAVLARSYMHTISFTEINRPIERAGTSLHRDYLPWRAISFVVIASGSINFKYGGNISRSIKHTGYKESTANVGSILCINNYTRRTRALSPHSSSDGTGVRLLMDFF